MQPIARYWQVFQRKVKTLQAFLCVRRVMLRSLIDIKNLTPLHRHCADAEIAQIRNKPLNLYDYS
jgi:hypothetical protein